MRVCAISFAYEIGNDIFDSNAFRDSGQHRIISSCTPIFFLGSHGAMGRHAATKAGRGGRLGAADRPRRDRALHPKAKPKAKTKRRYQWICTSSGSEDFGLPYSPRERAARKKKEEEEVARLAEEEEEEESRDSEKEPADSEEDPGTSTRARDSQTTEGSTSRTGTTRSSN